MARRYVSIKEVAARAAVSFQTASKVLNGGNVRVSAETAAWIIAVADSLGYRPNTSALASASRRVPDVAVVSCDDMPFAEYLIPPLSSLRVPFTGTGQEAVKLLLRSIAGEPAPESTVRLPVGLIVGDSCGGRPAPATPVAFSPVVPPPGSSPAHREKQKEDS